MLTENEKRVLRYVALHAAESPSINKVARECKITPNGAYKILRKLEEEGILQFKEISNIKSYHIEFKNSKSTNIMELALTQKTLKSRVKYRNEELKPFRKIAEACILFGSYIEDKKEPNDLDVLFVFDRKNYDNYKRELNKLKEISPVKIHDIIQTRSDLLSNIKKEDKIILNILENGTVLWGQEVLVRIIKNVS